MRVVRNCKGRKHSEYAPEEGNRYDGIYKVGDSFIISSNSILTAHRLDGVQLSFNLCIRKYCVTSTKPCHLYLPRKVSGYKLELGGLMGPIELSLIVVYLSI